MTRIFTILLMVIAVQSQAGNIDIAVASNFTPAMRALAKQFETGTGHSSRISSASTGKLYAQLRHGAPYDAFLSADEATAERLLAEGKAVTGKSRVYAVGKLVFVSGIEVDGACIDVLKQDRLRRLAIANPKTAPYGAAAKQVLTRLGMWQAVEHKLVTGENIAQTLQFVATGNAGAGFIARSLLMQDKNLQTACSWNVPANLHEPIKQKMVILNRAADNKAAKDFWTYMQSEDAMQIIQRFGYDTEPRQQ